MQHVILTNTSNYYLGIPAMGSPRIHLPKQGDTHTFESVTEYRIYQEKAIALKLAGLLSIQVKEVRLEPAKPAEPVLVDAIDRVQPEMVAVVPDLKPKQRRKPKEARPLEPPPQSEPAPVADSVIPTDPQIE